MLHDLCPARIHRTETLERGVELDELLGLDRGGVRSVVVRDEVVVAAPALESGGASRRVDENLSHRPCGHREEMGLILPRLRRR